MAVSAGVREGAAGETGDEAGLEAALVVTLVVTLVATLVAELLTAGGAAWAAVCSARFRSFVHLATSTGADSRRRAPASQSGTPKCAPLKISSMGGDLERG